MKIKIILAMSLVIGLTACGKKTDSADTTKASSTEGEQKALLVTQPTSNELAKKSHASAPLVNNEVNKAAKGTIHDADNREIESTPAVAVSTEQALGQTIGHAQKITKSQKSETRQRGQSAEDEMLKELEQQKR